MEPWESNSPNALLEPDENAFKLEEAFWLCAPEFVVENIEATETLGGVGSRPTLISD